MNAFSNINYLHGFLFGRLMLLEIRMANVRVVTPNDVKSRMQLADLYSDTLHQYTQVRDAIRWQLGRPELATEERAANRI